MVFSSLLLPQVTKLSTGLLHVCMLHVTHLTCPTRTPICPSRVEGPFVVLCLAQHDPDAESRENREWVDVII
jgi:hypothetical protein